MTRHRTFVLASIGLVLTLASCGGSTETTNTGGAGGNGGTSATATGGAGTGGTTNSSTTSSSTSASSSSGSPVDCTSATTNIEKVVCAANGFLATLSAAEQSSTVYAWTDSVAKTRWSNLPGVQRNGIKFGSLSATSRAAAMGVAEAALSASGYADFVGVLAADDYLGTMGGMGPGGGYSSDNYAVSFIGTPSTTGDWMLMIGGHHMAWNITYLAGVGYPTPNHIGAEPKASFTVNNASYQPLKDEGDALAALFGSLSSTDLASAYLSGQSFADVLLGPDEYQTGSYSNVVFPTGANRKGVLVSSLSDAQKALVTAAIAAWVRDYDPAVADSLMDLYTSEAAYADTLIAWAGTQAKGVDVDVNGTYMRIDGPRVWIEIACQGGVVIQGQTHFHMIFRDKMMDYGNSL